MKVWITKYALTTGIQEIEAELAAPGMVKRTKDDWISEFYHGEGREWHMNLGCAKEKAESMRRNKIASLKKSLARMENLKF